MVFLLFTSIKHTGETGKIYCTQTVYMIRCAEYRIYTVCENTVIIR